MTGSGLAVLRRFAASPGPAAAPGSPAPAAAAPPAAEAVAGEAAGSAAGGERCEMCGEVLDERHGHLVDTGERSLVCACRACFLLFTSDGAAGGRYRAVGDRYRHDPAAPLSRAAWGELQIPVALAFFFRNSALGRVVASYPSPAGATECDLDLAAWDALAAGHPLLRAMRPDVEAIIAVRGEQAVEAFLVPIDACYSLAGRLRLCWRGFDGGAEVRQLLAEFVSDLRQRASALGPEE